jgi:hypothetical protein
MERGYVATADILYELRVELRSCDHLLEQLIDEEVELGILKASLESLG